MTKKKSLAELRNPSLSHSRRVIQECLAGSDAANVPVSNKACYAAVKRGRLLACIHHRQAAL